MMNEAAIDSGLVENQSRHLEKEAKTAILVAAEAVISYSAINTRFARTAILVAIGGKIAGVWPWQMHLKRTL